MTDPGTEAGQSPAMSLVAGIDDTLARALVEAVPDGLLVVDRDGRIVVTNHQLERAFGYDPGELVGLRLETLLPERFREEHRHLRAAYAEAPRSRPMGAGNLALRGLRRDGSELPVEVALSPLSGPDTSLVLALVRDVSERRATAAALQAAHERALLAEDHERIARDLHDTVVQRLFASGLTLQALAARVPEGLRSRILEVIDDHDLIIREIRTAIFGLAATRTVAGEVRAAVLDVVDQSARPLGFRPSVRFDGLIEGIDDDVAEHLVAVLREALSNAARHAESSRVNVDLRQESGTLTLVVSDNGRGVVPGSGVGSGLANMAQRASELNGTFEVRTASRGGTIVTWSVPAQIGGKHGLSDSSR